MEKSKGNLLFVDAFINVVDLYVEFISCIICFRSSSVSRTTFSLCAEDANSKILASMVIEGISSIINVSSMYLSFKTPFAPNFIIIFSNRGEGLVIKLYFGKTIL